MKKRVKRLAVLVCLAVCISLFPSAALASGAPAVIDSGLCGDNQAASMEFGRWVYTGTYAGGDNMTWTLTDDGVLTIGGTGKMEDHSPDDPGTSWRPYSDMITTVIIEDGVNRIGMEAFMYCTNISSITIPASVEYFGDFVFDSRIGLKTAGPIGGGYDYEFGWTESIPPRAFSSCEALESIALPDSVTEIGSAAFMGCASLRSIRIPAGVTSIGENAFNGCSSLEAIEVDADNAFYSSRDGVLFDKDGTALLCVPGGKTGSYTIPSGLASIRKDTFYDCESLESVTLPDDITSIGGSMFFQCKSLKSITIPDSVTSIGGSAFYFCESLTEITIPDSVTTIGGGAFIRCESLTEITIPDSVTDIGGSTFDGCKSLESITLPDSLTSIGTNIFHDCESLRSITIPDGVTDIGNSAFEDCGNLRSITIPQSVTSIGYFAFYGCESLTDVYYGGSESDWADVEIRSSNDPLYSATIHFNAAEPADAEADGRVTLLDAVLLLGGGKPDRMQAAMLLQYMIGLRKGL